MSIVSKASEAVSTLSKAMGLSDAITKTTGRMTEVVVEVASSWERNQKEIREALSSDESTYQSEFAELLRKTKASSTRFQQACLNLQKKWQSKKEIMQQPLDKGEVDLDFVKDCIDSLSDLLSEVSKCEVEYKVFNEDLNATVKCAVNLEGKAKIEAEKAEREASNTRTTGYTAASILGFAALGLLTGGAGLVVAGAAGAAGIGTAVYTHNTAGRLDKLGEQFNQLKNKLQSSISELNRIGDDIEKLQAVTKTMASQIEDLKLLAKKREMEANNRQEKEQAERLKLQREKEDMRQENLKKDKEIEDLRMMASKNQRQSCVCSVL